MATIKLHRIVPPLVVAAMTAIPALATIQFLQQSAVPSVGIAANPIKPSSPSLASPSVATGSAPPAKLSIHLPAGMSGDGAGDGAGDGGGDDGGRVRLHANLAPAAPPAATRSANPAKPGSVKSGTFTGSAVSDPFGTVQVQVTVAGGKVTNVNATAPMNSPLSSSINSQALPLLKSEVLQAQSASVNAISGATLTSQAYQQSLQSALTQAGI